MMSFNRRTLGTLIVMAAAMVSAAACNPQDDSGAAQGRSKVGVGADGSGGWEEVPGDGSGGWEEIPGDGAGGWEEVPGGGEGGATQVPDASVALVTGHGGNGGIQNTWAHATLVLGADR